VDAAIRHLTEKSEDSLAAASEGGTSHIETACVLLASYVDLLPARVSQRMREARPAVSVDAVWLNNRLRNECSDRTGWFNIENGAASDEYFSTIFTHETVNTFQFLSLLHYRLANRPEKISEPVMQAIEALLGKFERFGRIFTCYTGDFRKASDTYDFLLNYGLLSLVLLGIHDRQGKPEFLNTALKINDLLVSTLSYLRSSLETLVATASLCYCKSEVETFYDSRGFRLPSGQ
jgi:hypothetical protein